MIDLKKSTCLSNPPKWHSSLKQHLNHVTEKANKKPVMLTDVTHILANSGFVSVVDVYNISQTCKEMCRATTNRQSIWKSICLKEFPSGMGQIPPIIVQEKGYKWLYREWKSTIRSSEGHRKRAKVYLPLPHPRLSADQIMFCIHLNGQNDRPLHKIPIALTGNDLFQLLSDGKMTHCFPEPVHVPIANDVCDGQSKSNNQIHVRIHLLSLSDASMCCVYNERAILPWHTKYDVKHNDFDILAEKPEYIDVGPTDVATYHNCDLRLGDSPVASEIKQRLFGNTIVFRAGLRFAGESDDTIPNQTDRTTSDTFVMPIIGLDIKVMKYERLQSTCTLFDGIEMDDRNGGVTILHYLSELQLS